MTRWALPLAIAVVAVLGYFLISDDNGDRAGRRDNTGESDDRAKRTRAEDNGKGDSVDEAMAQRLADLIKTHGGFHSKGTVTLLRPIAAGAGLAVTLEGQVDGAEGPISVAGETDASGAFALPQLPRIGSFTLRIEGARVQTLVKEGVKAPSGDTHDFGELFVARYYFVKGRVLGDSRLAVADADVALTDPPSGNGFSFMRASQEVDRDDPILASTTAGADGSFSLKLKEPGIFILRTSAKGWANHYKRDLVVGGATDVTVNVALTRGYPVVGYVLDATGRPTQAAVTLYAAGWGMSAWPKEVQRVDGDGRFEFRVEPGARRYTLSVVPDAGVNMSRNFQVPLNEDLILKLPGTGTVVGRVIDAMTGQPLAKADVLLAIGSGRMPDFSKAIVTDEFGRFRVGGVGAGKLQSVSVRIEGYADMRAGAWMGTDPIVWQRLQQLSLSPDSEVSLGDFPMAKGKILFGMVTDKDSGDPVPGADVQLWDFIMGNRSTRADESGMYRFVGVSDRIALIVERDGYAAMRDRPFPGFQLEGDSPEVRRDVELTRGATVSGVVKDENGTKLRGVLVRLQPAQQGWAAMMSAMSLRDLWGHTNEKGEYRIEGVPPIAIKVEATAEGFDKTQTNSRTVKPGEVVEKLDVKMLPAASLQGVIRSRDGGAVDAARLTIARDPGDNPADGARWAALGAGTTAFSNEKGQFTVGNVPVGKLLIRVEKKGFAITTYRREVKAGESVTDVRLDLPPAFQIKGKVVNEKGDPVGNCWIRARHTASPDGEPVDQLLGARVTADGTFTLDAMPDGTYEIEVRIGNWGGANAVRYENLKRPGVAAGTMGLVLEVKVAEG